MQEECCVMVKRARGEGDDTGEIVQVGCLQVLTVEGWEGVC
jgi:hypothetical protein